MGTTKGERTTPGTGAEGVWLEAPSLSTAGVATLHALWSFGTFFLSPRFAMYMREEALGQEKRRIYGERECVCLWERERKQKIFFAENSECRALSVGVGVWPQTRIFFVRALSRLMFPRSDTRLSNFIVFLLWVTSHVDRPVITTGAVVEQGV